MSTKPLVIYHADCTDGFGAAFAAWLKFGDEAEYLPMHYGQVKTVAEMNSVLATAGIPDGEGEVYILDFSLPKDVMEWLIAEVKRVVWLDHHKSAFEMWCGKYEKGIFYMAVEEDNPRIKIHLNDNKSGALLAWEYFHPNTEVPMLIRHIDDRDRWQFKLAGSKELHTALASYKPWSFEQWDAHFFVEGVQFNALLDVGRSILRAQAAHIESMMKQARKCTIPAPGRAVTASEVAAAREGTDMTLAEAKTVAIRMAEASQECYLGYGFKNGGQSCAAGLACNSQLHQSELGHELANKSGTFGLVWYVAQDNTVKCSLRSNGDYDVEAIAKTFGGGGHLNAAGFQTDIDTLMGWLR